MKLNSLIIGDLVANVPIIQGGMGVGVSLSSLAGAVAKEGAIGVISAAQPGFLEDDFEKDSLTANIRALGKHIKKAKEISNGGIIGVNIMCATRNYEEYVKCTIDNGADLIISGAGLPTDLPKFTEGSNIKLVPIVSPPKSASVILKMWDRRYGRTADMVIIEGPKAGGHLGFSSEILKEYQSKDYDKEVIEIIEIVKQYEDKYNKKIPVIFAGGVYNRDDINHYINLGCSGVQMATRFVATEECDAHINFKMAYVNAKKEDVMIVKSPVGMPGRAISNKFMEERKLTNEKINKCYKCLKKCDMATIPYCITGALVRAAKGDVNNSLIFCGENAYKLDKIITVKELINELNN
ncbi:nitronate monooxygenase family protein [uncultured Clostridium sp.]|uniref:NAD(P)H-dependent flavin oxidoreductase n=1 Tax=uncultured Clostridium sp. TaxID=59620 RepID=UPI0025DEAACA|nr:nitronate monooxygenase family protein [uncultured Clostridium sp.]MDU4882331.1 nitronate monooxygenase family protein [Clostridium celatum]MDU7075601.1 nitronate monooxygenase family protein [Clostridium celatum]